LAGGVRCKAAGSAIFDRLEPANPLRGPRLRDVWSLGSSAEMPLLRDGNELAQLSDLDAPLIHILDVSNQYIIGLVRQIMVD
jgi:hypothetical protein